MNSKQINYFDAKLQELESKISTEFDEFKEHLLTNPLDNLDNLLISIDLLFAKTKFHIEQIGISASMEHIVEDQDFNNRNSEIDLMKAQHIIKLQTLTAIISNHIAKRIARN